MKLRSFLSYNERLIKMKTMTILVSGEKKEIPQRFKNWRSAWTYALKKDFKLLHSLEYVCGYRVDLDSGIVEQFDHELGDGSYRPAHNKNLLRDANYHCHIQDVYRHW